MLREVSMSKINYYDVLGVPRDCEQSLIETVYKSMVKVFHPDVFKGDKNFAQQKLKLINEAYSIIGSPDQRFSYDAELRKSEESGVTEEIYEDENSDFEFFYRIYDKEWSVAIGYFPEIEGMHAILNKLHINLAFAFKIGLLSTKKYRDASSLFESAKSNFLKQKFGENKQIQALALSAIETGNRSFALELNRHLSIIGESEYFAVLYGLYDKYKDFCEKNYPKFGFNSLLSKYRSFGLYPGTYKTKNSGSYSKMDLRVFGVRQDYTVFIQVPTMFGTKSVSYDSIDKLIESGELSETAVRTAQRID